MKKIIFGITDLSIGGAEKTLVELCNKLSNKYEITIFTLYSQGLLEKELNSNVKIFSLYKKSFNDINIINKKIISLKLVFLKNFIYKKYIKNKFDVEIAFLEGPITRLFSSRNKAVKKIAWIHTDISLIFGNNIKSKIKKLLDRKIYKNYNELIFVSRNALNSFEQIYNIPVNKDVIYNYINTENILKKSEEKINFEFDKNTTNFLSVSRLVKPKAIDRLIRVHSKLIKNGVHHKIYVIGDGPEKNNLLQLIKALKVEDTFLLLGQKENPYPYIKNCNYFCLLSSYEGYGNVIEEAKVLSKYIIITDTASKEAVENYNNKTIIPNNEESLYSYLKEIIVTPPSYQTKESSQSNNNTTLKKIIEKLGD